MANVRRLAAAVAVMLWWDAAAAHGAAQTAPSPSGVPGAQAVRVEDGTIRVDGRLDEDAWRLAPALSSFWQVQPDEGEPASERTEVRIVFTADHALRGRALPRPRSRGHRRLRRAGATRRSPKPTASR